MYYGTVTRSPVTSRSRQVEPAIAVEVVAVAKQDILKEHGLEPAPERE